jgi:hypothetical protein
LATTYKVLAQSNPAATTNTDAYTVGTGKSAVISTIVIANLAAADATFRIAIRVAGAAITNAHYIAYNVTVGASDSTTLTLGVTLAATDVVTVYGSTATLAFNLFGSELS